MKKHLVTAIGAGYLMVSMLSANSVIAQGPVRGEEGPPKDSGYYDIGGFHRAVSTDSVSAQAWFDRGLAMCFAFNHEEAVRCFERAASADSSLAMAFWGMAYAWGPNINNLEIEPHQIAQADLSVRFARLYAASASGLERDLISALANRYAAPAPQDRDPLNRAYANAMREVYRRHPQDPMVAALFAESLMVLNPWNYWSPDGEPAVDTPELVEVLENALEQSPDDPGLCHFYIHLMEMSPTPAKALPAANRLRRAMPGAGHLVHMPSHIDVLLGDYEEVISANRSAVAADQEFLRREGAANFYTLYRVHHYHFLVYGAMFDGQSNLALRTSRELVTQIPEEMLKTQTDFLDAFVPTPLHVLVRFGQWDQVLAEPEPPAYLPVTRCIRHYARAVAHAAKGQVVQAKVEQALFHDVLPTVPETSILFNNTSRDILAVAEEMIAGEIAYRERDFGRAFGHLREAVRRDDDLNYDEPWGWMQPARHALGALLLEQGKADQAATVYREDLQRHPKNIWALHGLAECLETQGKKRQAARIREQFRQASKRADIAVDRSCFCRRSAPGSESRPPKTK